MAQQRAQITRARGALRRVRNAMAEAAPALAVLEEVVDVPDRIGRYRLEAGEEINERDVLDFLRLVRSEHPGVMDIVALGRSGESLSEVTGQQAEHSGENHGSSNRNAAAG